MSNYQNKQSLRTLAFGGGTPLKALLTACVVGSILTTINHGDAILDGNYPHPLKVILTYTVPYCVTTWGAITGKLQKIMLHVQEFLDKNKIIELSFFNFENAITAAYYADENLNLIKVNKNFIKFFPTLGDLENTNITKFLEELGVPEEQIIEFKTSLDKQDKVFIPAIDILINGQKRVFSLLSTKTSNDSFGFLNGVQGQFVDITNK
ncbi:MAG: nitrate/nitrite transporter NrtS [Oceanospirillaceae bacterium]|jgi:hypothetical protein|nr:nitrate/nitrite transporter NrtS [Oceanospirillaceae bacterium]MBT6076518.1 nitrate/nitrite transporter NrtS [Oceanospirillaceae bacterium]